MLKSINQMKNKFNKITSKEWLPFQKSWYRLESTKKLYKDTIRFFTDNELEAGVYYYGSNLNLVNEIISDEKLQYVSQENHDQNLQFILFDLRDEITTAKSIGDLEKIEVNVFNLIKSLQPLLLERRFISIIADNIYIDNSYIPFAWQLAKKLQSIISVKDEKILCYENPKPFAPLYSPKKNVSYQLFFRKDDSPLLEDREYSYLNNTKALENRALQESKTDMWFILKPQPRDKLEILHPAKYPEGLAKIFIEQFTSKGDYVLDPMSGTGSTQLAALMLDRNAIGTELSEYFCQIANKRCSDFINPPQTSLFLSEPKNLEFSILNIDARTINSKIFSKISYLITSPPYWDMLNMKGAENQAKRIEKGLKTNYSEDEMDLGNVSDYNSFITELSQIYIQISKSMEQGSFMTIVVKNIKKKGQNYLFAYDLSEKLISAGLVLLCETFWCQDDVSIAPFGYGNTWVSNTFHQYCLTFQIR